MRTTIAILLTIGLACLARADQYEMTWNTVDGGGVTGSTGGTYTLSGTIGQWDAGPAMSGGTYVVTGGFWRQRPCRRVPAI